MKEVISREPWWATPPQPGQGDADVEWGYLVRFSDNTFEFQTDRPTDDEIASRESCRLMVET